MSLYASSGETIRKEDHEKQARYLLVREQVAAKETPALFPLVHFLLEIS
jgi:hypothetical protein